MMPFSAIEQLLVLHAIPKVIAWDFPQAIQILNVHHSLINEYFIFSHFLLNMSKTGLVRSITFLVLAQITRTPELQSDML